MKQYIAMFMSCLIMQVLSFDVSAEDKSVMITLSSDRNVILPCEPIGVSVILKNMTNNEVEITGNRWTSIRIKKEGENENWKTFAACGPQVASMFPRKLTISPLQTVEDMYLIHVDINDEPVFKSEGIYYLQAGTPFGESEDLKIVVDSSGIPTNVVEMVYKDKLFMLFDKYTADWYMRNGDKEDIISGRINKFKQEKISSPYSDWMAVSEFILKLDIISHESELTKKKMYEELVAEYTIVANTLPSPQKETLLIELASVQEEQSNKKQAIEILKQVESNHRSGYFNVRAKYLRGLYSKGNGSDL